MTYSLSGFLFEDGGSQSIGFPEFCRLAARLGYTGVELRRTQVFTDTAKSERRAMLDVVHGEGLEVTCFTTRRMPSAGPERDSFYLSYLELCADFECRLLKTGGEHEWMLWAADEAQEYGVTVARNNHVGTDLETVAGTREYLRSCKHSMVGLLYDSMHLNTGGEDYLQIVREFGTRIVNVLVHSVRPTDVVGESVHCMPDDPGAQDWRAIFVALRDAGYDGLVTVIENGWPVHERELVAQRNIEYLRGVEQSVCNTAE